MKFYLLNWRMLVCHLHALVGLKVILVRDMKQCVLIRPYQINYLSLVVCFKVVYLVRYCLAFMLTIYRLASRSVPQSHTLMTLNYFYPSISITQVLQLQWLILTEIWLEYVTRALIIFSFSTQRRQNWWSTEAARCSQSYLNLDSHYWVKIFVQIS